MLYTIATFFSKFWVTTSISFYHCQWFCIPIIYFTFGRYFNSIFFSRPIYFVSKSTTWKNSISSETYARMLYYTYKNVSLNLHIFLFFHFSYFTFNSPIYFCYCFSISLKDRYVVFLLLKQFVLIFHRRDVYYKKRKLTLVLKSPLAYC